MHDSTILYGSSEEATVVNGVVSEKTIILEQGSRGLAGPQGSTGPVGPQGAAGPTGPQGASGTNGVTGDTGPQGPQGSVGPQGATGSQGMTGPQGSPSYIVGPTGAKAGIEYYFDTATTAGAPQPGQLRYNNSTIANVSNLYLNKSTVNNINVANHIASWDDLGLSINRGQLFIEGNLIADLDPIAQNIVGTTGLTQIPTGATMGVDLFANNEYFYAGYWEIALPWTINFLGSNFGSAFVNTNGSVSFGGPKQYTITIPRAHIAIASGAQETTLANGMNTFRRPWYATIGGAPYRRFIIRAEGFNNIFLDYPITYEITFFEEQPDRIEIQINSNFENGATAGIWSTAGQILSYPQASFAGYILQRQNKPVTNIFTVTGSVVDNTTYFTVPVTYQSGDLPEASQQLSIAFTRTGAQGTVGSQGSVGPQGATGPQGPIGNTGAQGPIGPQGDVGPQGAQGPIGSQGPQGATGAQGTYTVSDTAPVSPSVGDVWYNSATGRTYIRYDGYWVEAAGGVGGPSQVMQSYTPIWTQGVTITKDLIFAKFQQVGQMVFGSVRMKALSNGTSGDIQLVTLPIAAASTNYVMGSGIWCYDYEPDYQSVTPIFHDANTVEFVLTVGTDMWSDYNYLNEQLGIDTDYGWVQYDSPYYQSVLSFNFMYEAA